MTSVVPTEWQERDAAVGQPPPGLVIHETHSRLWTGVVTILGGIGGFCFEFSRALPKYQTFEALHSPAGLADVLWSVSFAFGVMALALGADITKVLSSPLRSVRGGR